MHLANGEIQRQPLAISKTFIVGTLRKPHLDADSASPTGDAVNPRHSSTASRCSPPAKKGALSRYTAVVLLMGATHKGVRVHFDNAKAIVPE